jgi:hypothetical protein
MKGFIYRLGVKIKEAGERAGHRRRFYAGAMIRAGLAVRNCVLKARGGMTKKAASRLGIFFLFAYLLVCVILKGFLTGGLK